jgi:DedD protein
MKKAPLEFYEALKKDEPDTAVQIPAVQAPTDGPSALSEASGTGKPPHKLRSDLMDKKSTAKVKPTENKTPSAAAAPVSTTGNLTIQVASLKDAAAAERIIANLKKDGYPAYLSRIVIPNQGLWFRVRVGRYNDPKQAVADMDRLTRDQKKPILVKK